MQTRGEYGSGCTPSPADRLCAGAALPGAFPLVPGEAAGRFCSAEERSGQRFGETQPPEGAGQDAAHLRQGHAGRDG